MWRRCCCVVVPAGGSRHPPGSSSLTGPAALVVLLALPVGFGSLLCLLFCLVAPSVVAIMQHAFGVGQPVGSLPGGFFFRLRRRGTGRFVVECPDKAT